MINGIFYILGAPVRNKNELQLFELALVFVRFNHVVTIIVNADHGIM